MSELKQRLTRALALDQDYDYPVQHKKGTPSAVLILFWDRELLLTKRTETVATHPGHVAFPGGILEPSEDAVAAALRENEEELGLSPKEVEVLGRLPDLWTTSGFSITPVVGWWRPAHAPVLRPSPEEIARAFWVGLEELSKPGVYRREDFTLKSGATIHTHVYYVSGERVWGATGAILWNLLKRLSQS